MARSVTLGVDPSTVVVIGTGGDSRLRAEYQDGSPTGKNQTRDGADLRALSGVAVSVGGVGLDGASVLTTTPLEEIEAGAMFRAEGTCEVTVRADARPGFGDRGPRGEVQASIYVQTLTPLGSAMDLLKAGAQKRAGADS